jgi:hypothetical protein
MIALLEGDGMIIPSSGITRQAMPEALSAPIDTFIPISSFHDWLRNRPDEAPAAENLATIIASAGATDCLREFWAILQNPRPHSRPGYAASG